ncbi:fumarylacetoacetate hydrolase family protein [Mycobacterium sp. 3519A]|uniref:fumarylacetoacetate hydrolase family protein n=1 Tax=Mycobacterium sp. 3519A TaxID=2057184 RepID=UPI000C79D3C4|nr:fumarylacetoacetate hydrolase family protein [Mycobacterium sp. 3519A]
MRLATIRLGGSTAAVRADSDTAATLIPGFADLSGLLAEPKWRTIAAAADGAQVDLATAEYAPVVPSPGKIICVGLNYASHIIEMGREIPQYPTLFAKFKEALTGPYDDVHVPGYAAAELDWEAELAVIIGAPAFRVSAAEAEDRIAGYSILNDYTMRDFQYRTPQWDQGKTFEKTSGFGPFLDTEFQLGGTIETRLDGEVMQSASTDDLVFGPAALIEYISHIVSLQPGDVIATGTPSGVGHARSPKRYIGHGQTVAVRIDGLGTLCNTTLIGPEGR